ncbi:MAG: translation initiation factor IF-3 [Saprospiraceae bacterium]|nr:translation initiation factor IF-3 [Saprospiraceae bacterium]
MARRIKRVRRSKPKHNFRVNEKISIPKIRLVGDDLEEIGEEVGEKITPGIIKTERALEWARQVGLDLVEISPKADPPVCKIIDLNKFLYNKKKKEKEMKAKTAKTVVKEIRFGPNTDDHDFNFKLNHAKKFLSEGAKVKAYVHFRGRTIIYKDRGRLLLLRFLQELEDYGIAEELPKQEGRRMFVMVAPKK